MKKKDKKEHCEDDNYLGLSTDWTGYFLSHPTYDSEGNKIIYVNGVEVGRIYTRENYENTDKKY